MELSKEKGHYSVFPGSDWETGDYFKIRDYINEDGTDVKPSSSEEEGWAWLAQQVKTHGVRNAYIQAIAPNASTSIIAGSTASIDPIFRRQYSEEKKDYKTPVTAPDLSSKTFWFYKNAYEVDQQWSIKQNAARQRHVDQSISFNIYVKKNVKASELLNYHMTAWENNFKTTYYVRSTAVEIEDCESCAS